MGEQQQLRKRASQIFERIETQIKQILRQAEIEEGLVTTQPVSVIANLLLACVEGRVNQYIRGGFNLPPSHLWPDQWALISGQLFCSEKYTA